MKPSVEFIIRVSLNSALKNIKYTLESIKKADCISFCFDKDYTKETKVLLNKNLLEIVNNKYKWKIHFPTGKLRIEDCINLAAEKSICDYYIFINAGHKLPNDFGLPENCPIFMMEPIDDEYNEFVCRTKLHKMLGGFGKEYSLIEKWNHLLEQLKELKSANSTTAVSRNSNM